MPFDPFILKNQNAGGWCWVAEKPLYARFAQSYIWAWLAMISIILIYSLILVHMIRGMHTILFVPISVACVKKWRQGIAEV